MGFERKFQNTNLILKKKTIKQFQITLLYSDIFFCLSTTLKESIQNNFILFIFVVIPGLYHTMHLEEMIPNLI